MSSTVFAYPLDPTGRNPANRVEGELHTLAPKKVRAVIPRYGPYYTASLRVYDNDTGVPLQRNTQYRCVELLQDASMQYGQEICALILIVDSTVSADIRIEYQVLGGYFTNDVTVLSTLYEAVVNDTRPVDWENVEDKPLMYPPTMHRHVLSDVYGWEPIVSVLERIRSAIVLSNVPAFEALLDYVDEQIQAYYTKIDDAVAVSAGHAGLVNNPHGVTKAQVGLGDVSNLAVVSLDEVKAGIPVNKYLTHEMFIAAIAAMGGIGGGGSGGGGSVDTPTYSLTHSTASVLEGYRVTFTVTTTLVADNTVVYWTVVYMGSNSLDFKAIGGMVGIKANTATFDVEVVTDSIVEYNEAFAVQLHLDSLLGRVVATSNMVVIEDVAPIVIPVKSPAEVFAAGSFYEPGIATTAQNYYWVQDEGRDGRKLVEVSDGRRQRIGTRRQHTGNTPVPPPPALVYPVPGVISMPSPYYTGEITSTSLFIVQPLLKSTVSIDGRNSDKQPKRIQRTGGSIPVVPPLPVDKNDAITMAAESLYSLSVQIDPKTYFWVGNIGGRLQHDGNTPVPYVPPTPIVARSAYHDACCLYDPVVAPSAAAYYIVGRIGLRHFR